MSYIKPTKRVGIADKSNHSTIAALAILWLMLTLTASGFLYRLEQTDLFLFTHDFFIQKTARPGGILSWLSAFLTQFMHIPWLGALILTTIYLAVVKLNIRTFSIPDSQRAIALIPAALLVSLLMHTGYLIYKIKFPSMAFVPALGFLVATFPANITNRLHSTASKLSWLTIWTLFAYPATGVFALIGTLSSTLTILGNNRYQTKEKVLAALSAGVLIGLTPLLWYFIFSCCRLANSWIALIPPIPDGCVFSHYVPFFLLGLWFIVIPFLGPRLPSGKQSHALQICSYAAIILYVLLFWFKDFAFYAETSMSWAADRNDWQKVVNIHRCVTRLKTNEPTRLMVMYKDLALFKLHREGDEAFSLRDGNRPQHTPVYIPLSLQAGKEFYFHYGLENFSFRWCIETHAESGWGTGSLRYAAMSSAVSGQTATSVRFLTMLRHTIFYNSWAGKQLELVNNPELIAQDEIYSSVLPLLFSDNWFDNDMSLLEDFLSGYFTERFPDSANEDYYRAAMLWAARKCNMEDFLYLYGQWLPLRSTERVPVHYQEALILFAGIEPNINVTHFPFDNKVRASYASYRKYLEQHSGITSGDDEFRRYFSRTYYYYYNTKRDERR